MKNLDQQQILHKYKKYKHLYLAKGGESAYKKYKIYKCLYRGGAATVPDIDKCGTSNLPNKQDSWNAYNSVYRGMDKPFLIDLTQAQLKVLILYFDPFIGAVKGAQHKLKTIWGIINKPNQFQSADRSEQYMAELQKELDTYADVHYRNSQHNPAPLKDDIVEKGKVRFQDTIQKIVDIGGNDITKLHQAACLAYTKLGDIDKYTGNLQSRMITVQDFSDIRYAWFSENWPEDPKHNDIVTELKESFSTGTGLGTGSGTGTGTGSGSGTGFSESSALHHLNQTQQKAIFSKIQPFQAAYDEFLAKGMTADTKKRRSLLQKVTRKKPDIPAVQQQGKARYNAVMRAIVNYGGDDTVRLKEAAEIAAKALTEFNGNEHEKETWFGSNWSENLQDNPIVAALHVLELNCDEINQKIQELEKMRKEKKCSSDTASVETSTTSATSATSETSSTVKLSGEVIDPCKDKTKLMCLRMDLCQDTEPIHTAVQLFKGDQNNPTKKSLGTFEKTSLQENSFLNEIESDLAGVPLCNDLPQDAKNPNQECLTMIEDTVIQNEIDASIEKAEQVDKFLDEEISKLQSVLAELRDKTDQTSVELIEYYENQIANLNDTKKIPSNRRPKLTRICPGQCGETCPIKKKKPVEV